MVSFQHRGALVKLAFLVNSRVFDRYIEVVEFVYKATYHWEVAKKGPSKRDERMRIPWKKDDHCDNSFFF